MSLLNAAKRGKEVHVTLTIGKNMKHPWLTQNVLALRAVKLNYIYLCFLFLNSESLFSKQKTEI